MSKKIKDSGKKEMIITYEKTYVIVAILMASLMTAVFFGMALPVEGFYYSDTPVHIRSGAVAEGYGLEAIFIYLMGKFVTFPMLQLIVAVYETVLVMATWMLSQKFINEFFNLNRGIVLAISSGLVFLTAIYIPGILPFFYKDGLGTQPWHNSTYYGMRLFGVVYIMLLFRVLPRYLNGITRSEWGRIAWALALTTMFKPNFLLSVCAVLGLIFLIDLIRERSLETFKNIVILGTTVLPSLFVLVVQYILIYVFSNTDGASGIEVVWFSDLMWNGAPSYMFVKLFRQVAFMFVVIALDYRLKCWDKLGKTDIHILFSITLFVASLAIFSLFKETGPRAAHGNFGWCIPMGYYVMYLYIVPWFFQRYREWRNDVGEGRKSGDKCLFAVGMALLLLHFMSGIRYFVIIMSGVSYYR